MATTVMALDLDRYDKADVVAVIGMALASAELSGYALTSYEWLGEGGIGLAVLAILSNLYVKHKAKIVRKIDEARHKVFDSAHKEGDEELIEDVLDAVAEVVGDVAEDALDDGELNRSND